MEATTGASRLDGRRGNTTSHPMVEVPSPYDEDVLEFWSSIAKPRWVAQDYMEKCDADRIQDNDFISRADLDECKAMFTHCRRGEHWSGPGYFGEMLQAGRIQAVLRRLRELRESLAVCRARCSIHLGVFLLRAACDVERPVDPLTFFWFLAGLAVPVLAPRLCVVEAVRAGGLSI